MKLTNTGAISLVLLQNRGACLGDTGPTTYYWTITSAYKWSKYTAGVPKGAASMVD